MLEFPPIKTFEGRLNRASRFYVFWFPFLRSQSGTSFRGTTAGFPLEFIPYLRIRGTLPIFFLTKSIEASLP